ncbi:TD and POZ domain-containing protein 2-like [Bradysia coprophila]|uniref:TD and POZ domain-containing protein 2-like n=1 Tax=Bradysia coprophila TaxID=38358 RepID=UPI00187DD486|nr:TD and POZ domain-containing protein 2-like [Bradysia coprophila]
MESAIPAIPIRQKMCSNEVILESEILFEIANLENGYKDGEDICFAAETLEEANISWWITAKKLTYKQKMYFDFVIQVHSDIWKSGKYQFCQSLQVTHGYSFHCSGFKQLSQQLVVKTVIVDMNYLLGHVTSNGSLHVIGKLKLKNLGEKTLRRVNFTRLANQYTSTQYHSILNDPTFSDFTFVVQNKEFKVHKAIVGASSEVMRLIFTADLQESRQGRCNVVDIDPEVFGHLLRFMYTGQLPDALDGISGDLLKAAHFYGVTELFEICKQYLQFQLSADNAVDIYEFCSLYELAELKLEAWNFVTWHILKISTPLKPLPVEDVRELIKAKAKINSILRKHQILPHDETMRTVLR